MTNAIEQAKREMYSRIATLKFACVEKPIAFEKFESALEQYLENVRVDHEGLHETARKRFEDLQAAEAANQELQARNDKQCESIRSLLARLAKMTEERDSIQLRLHAVDHAYKPQQELAATPTQDSGDRGSCEATEANAEVIRAAVRSIQLVITDWGMGDLKAKKAMRQIARIVNGDGTIADACGSLEKDRYEIDEKSLKMRAMLDAVDQHKRGTCMHSFHPMPISRDDKTEICVYCGIRRECQHSFFAIGDSEMKCTFCGVGK